MLSSPRLCTWTLEYTNPQRWSLHSGLKQVYNTWTRSPPYSEQFILEHSAMEHFLLDNLFHQLRTLDRHWHLSRNSMWHPLRTHLGIRPFSSINILWKISASNRNMDLTQTSYRPWILQQLWVDSTSEFPSNKPNTKSISRHHWLWPSKQDIPNHPSSPYASQTPTH